MNEKIELFLVVLSFLIIFSLFIISSSIYLSYLTSTAECEKLDSYGYKVQFLRDGLNHRCEVKTERGIWIDSRDFNIASVEEFVRK